VHTRSAFQTLTAGLLAAALLAGCKKDSTGPGGGGGDGDGSSTLNLAIAVRVNPDTLRATGDFYLELIPSSTAGELLVSQPWTITTALTAPAQISTSVVSQNVTTPDSRPVAIAIDFDDSGSMAANDPSNRRVLAGRQFAGALLAQNGANQISAFDFGMGSGRVTPGFYRTRKIDDWTSDSTQFIGALDSVQTIQGGSSYIFGSAKEVAIWIDSTRSATSYRRAVMLMTDGRPDDPTVEDALISIGQQTGVPVYAVGLGPAASGSAAADTSAVQSLERLSDETGGLYSSAVSASAIQPVLQAFAASTSGGTLLVRVHLSALPAAGTAISGTVKLSNLTLGSVHGPWSFSAP
jgi:hypothetical protein